MRYRKLSPTGDMLFGNGQSDFYINNAEAIGQYAETRLRLMVYEWFLDLTDGTPYGTQILGVRTQSTYDLALRARILQTQGVNSIIDYASVLSADRALDVTAEVDTIYGPTQLATTVNAQTNPFN